MKEILSVTIYSVRKDLTESVLAKFRVGPEGVRYLDGDRSFLVNLKLSGVTGPGNKRYFDKDGADFVKAIQRRYSGNRVRTRVERVKDGK